MPFRMDFSFQHATSQKLRNGAFDFCAPPSPDSAYRWSASPEFACPAQLLPASGPVVCLPPVATACCTTVRHLSGTNPSINAKVQNSARVWRISIQWQSSV